MEKILYHYCDLSSFEKILESKCLWLSNANKTNDTYELKWIFELLKQNNPEKMEFILSLEYFYNWSLLNYFRPHMLCFSKNGDLLSQWRAYANDGRGVSIGFRRNYFNKIQYTENLEFKIFDVIYNSSIQKRAIEPLFNNASLKNKVVKLLRDKSGLANPYLNILPHLASIYELGLKFKNPSFKEENEVRIVHGNHKMAAEVDMFSYRFTNDDMISFVQIPLDLAQEMPIIQEVILGPKSKITEKEIKLFLIKKLAYSDIIKVSKSKCSYK